MSSLITLTPFRVTSVFCALMMGFPPWQIARVKAGELMGEVRETIPTWPFAESVKRVAPLISEQVIQVSEGIWQSGNVVFMPNINEVSRTEFTKRMLAGSMLADASVNLLFHRAGGNVEGAANTRVKLFSDHAEMTMTYLPATTEAVSELGTGRIDAEFTVRFSSFIDRDEVKEMVDVQSAEQIPPIGMLVDVAISEDGGTPVEGVLIFDFGDFSSTSIALPGHDQTEFDQLVSKVVNTNDFSDFGTTAVSQVLFLCGMLLAVILCCIVCGILSWFGISCW